MKSLIVTGGANGLGRSIAESASKAGHRVGILDVNIGALEEAASSIENATPLVASVTSTDEIKAEISNYQVELDKTFYQQQRVGLATGYPSIQDQLDQLYHDMKDGKLGVAATTGSWYVGITSVKTAFPKS